MKIPAKVQKFLSRKLLMAGVATYLLVSGHISSTEWMGIAMLYIGGEAITNVITGKRAPDVE